MSPAHFDFFGELLVRVEGDSGRLDRQYRRMYDQFKTSSPDRDPDIVIEETTDDVEPTDVLGDPDDYYGWTGEEFVVRNGSDFMAVEPGWSHVRVTRGFEPFYAIYPMEFEIRKRRLTRDQALIHASGVSLDGQTTLFPAWRGAGKTNTLLSLLREGADFLSDDRLWVGADGTAVGYPLGVNLQPFNVESFPEIEIQYDDPKERLRSSVHEYIDARVDRTGGLPETAVAYLNDTYLADDSRDFTDISDLYPDADHVEQASVDNVVFLQAAPDTDTVTVEQVSTETAMSAATAISNFEWDGRLREYFHAYDSLVDDGTMVESLEEVTRRERDVFRSLFEDVATYRAYIPRERDWSESSLDTAVSEAVASLDSPRVIEAMS
ncbi:hypothetical protein [Haloarcula salina]|uniref:Uncharacterized protein n=1 Tax=Haloarcula salina TaxID=1429914 RepID=A0AA41G358_9EURY|nr:hypothetical protein [Haloarcula salina]MBV0902568.1 hypothetical protein [Haloarcula salina]